MQNPSDNYEKMLPPDWRLVRLGEVISEALPGFAIGERDAKGVVQLRMNNVDTRGHLTWDEFIRVPATEDAKTKYRLVPGDVVFNNTNSTELVGKSAVFKGYPEPVVYSNHFTRLRTKRDQLDSLYLANWLIYQYQKRIFENLCNRWIGQSAVKNDMLFQLEIPLPSLAEQKRIAATLDERIVAVEKARVAAASQLEAAKALPAAYLRQVFPTEGRELPPGWRWAKLAEVCDSQILNKDPRAVPEAKIIYVDISSIDNKNKKIIAAKELVGKDAPSRARQVIKEKDVIVSTTRPGLNAVAIIPSELDGQVCSTGFCVLRAISDVLTPELLFYLVQSSHFVYSLQDLVKGALYPAVTDNQVKERSMPIPPLPEQKCITAILDEQMASAECLRSGLEKQLHEINAVPGALLRRAFRGDL
jgi:type I restriction enzyme, S subunit